MAERLESRSSMTIITFDRGDLARGRGPIGYTQSGGSRYILLAANCFQYASRIFLFCQSESRQVS
jgi:hypothetical protein